ncbi:MAG: hypothetical protein R2851_07290 [Caldilineaceae bacterium]
MRTTSVIDTATAAQEAATTFGGIAHASARGISKVELQVDDGPWQEAELRVPPRSDLTWVQWRYTDTFPAGTHTARVRAYDGTGELQVMDESHPPGRRNWRAHSAVRRLRRQDHAGPGIRRCIRFLYRSTWTVRTSTGIVVVQVLTASTDEVDKPVPLSSRNGAR